MNDHHFYQTHGETLANGLKAGVDCFTDDGEIVYAAAREALDNGWITEKDIDESVRNSFRTRIRLGMFDKEGDCRIRTWAKNISTMRNTNNLRVKWRMRRLSF